MPATPLPNPTTGQTVEDAVGKKEYTDEEAIACSLENPEACEPASEPRS